MKTLNGEEFFFEDIEEINRASYPFSKFAKLILFHESCSKKWSQLHFAVYFHFYDIVKLGLEHGADVNSVNDNGDTPLHIACNGLITGKYVELLLRYHPDLNIQNKSLDTPLNIFVQNYYFDIDLVKLLLSKGADPNIPNREGNIPLHYLAKHTPCRISWNFFRDFTIALIEFGSNVNIQNSIGDTPLHLAIRYCAVEPIRILLTFSASILTKNREGLTSLDMALERKTYLNILNLIGEYAIVLDICKVPINQGHLRYISKFERLKIFKDKCDEEVIKLKQSKFPQSNITLYNILISSTNIVAKYLCNENIFKFWKRTWNIENYAIFGTIVSKNFENGFTRMKAEKNAYKYFRTLFPFLSDLCVGEIMSFLLNEDLNNFRLAFVKGEHSD